MFVLLFVGGTIMIALGFIGVYIGYIFQQVKDRPVYLVRRTLNAQPPQQPPATPPDA
jgi:dolichol-phosphate mannosyltransferase